MWELRWVLLGLGAALIVGVYLWGRGVFQRLVPKREIGRRWLASDEALQPSDVLPAPSDEHALDPGNGQIEPAPATTPAPPAQDRIVTVRFVAKDKGLSAEKAILALRAAGLQHGRYGIFHRPGEGGVDGPLFSVASLTEPGSFDLTNLSRSSIPGMSFFMILPGPGDPVVRFDLMVETARTLAHDLNAELHDERGSSWSIQRERYVREELIEYRHHYGRP